MCLQVLRNSGVEAILQPGGSCAPAVEVGAVHDALESLVAIAGASEEGRLVALQSGAIAAAATALQVGMAVQHGICALLLSRPLRIELNLCSCQHVMQLQVAQSVHVA